MLSLSKVLALGLCLVLVSEVTARSRGRDRGRTSRGRGRGPVLDPEPVVEETARDARFLSLFNVINFNNDACTSTSTGSLSTGTCYTAAQCTSRGGSALGSCAAGFGVCCVFVLSGTTGTVSNNNTHLRNAGFPSGVTTGSSSFTVNRIHDDICQLRLDFESFNLMGITDTTEATATAVCQDTFRVTTSTGGTLPTICGNNAGQHMYVDIGRNSGDTVMVNVNLAAGNMERSWDIKVAQIKCGASYAAPNGCLQYVTGLSGQFTTFNYLNTAQAHLPDQRYNYCIRQEEGMCCVTYNACGTTPGQTTVSNAFSLNQVDPVDNVLGQQDLTCLQDYIGLSGGSSSCQRGVGGFDFNNRFCGPFLTAMQSGAAFQSICACQQPFMVEVFTDNNVDGTLNTALSHGACLDWQQVPC